MHLLTLFPDRTLSSSPPTLAALGYGAILWEKFCHPTTQLSGPRLGVCAKVAHPETAPQTPLKPCALMFTLLPLC